MPLDGQDPYTLLGVTPESSLQEVRERYRILVQIWHPDRHQSSPAKVREEVVQQMQRINAAYDFVTEARNAKRGNAKRGNGLPATVNSAGSGTTLRTSTPPSGTYIRNAPPSMR